MTTQRNGLADCGTHSASERRDPRCPLCRASAAEARVAELLDLLCDLLDYRRHRSDCAEDATDFCTCGMKQVADRARAALAGSQQAPAATPETERHCIHGYPESADETVLGCIQRHGSAGSQQEAPKQAQEGEPVPLVNMGEGDIEPHSPASAQEGEK